jgi:DNA-directed RNA polymerase I, II, and III subunit RPABC3
MTLTLDIANELYPLSEGDIFSMVIARNLVPEEAGGDDEDEGDGVKRVKKELWRSEDQGLAADYEYVMLGKVRLSFML